MAREDQREHFARYKDDVEKRGKPFFPYAMFHDTVMSFVVVAVIAGLAAVWYFTSQPPAGAEYEPGHGGLLGPRYTEEADPGTTSFVPRPDWYFYFLFYLLLVFEWPESVILGTVGIPTVLLILLFALPFVDRRRERRLSRRPVAVVAALLVIASMGILTYEGATKEEPSAAGGETLLEDTNRTTDDEQVLAGADLFGQVGCLTCHRYGSAGTTAIGAPELTDIGDAGRGEDYWVRWVRNPQEIRPGSPMPGFPNLTDEQLQAIAAFMEHSTSDGG